MKIIYLLVLLMIGCQTPYEKIDEMVLQSIDSDSMPDQSYIFFAGFSNKIGAGSIWVRREDDKGFIPILNLNNCFCPSPFVDSLADMQYQCNEDKKNSEYYERMIKLYGIQNEIKRQERDQIISDYLKSYSDYRVSVQYQKQIMNNLIEEGIPVSASKTILNEDNFLSNIQGYLIKIPVIAELGLDLSTIEKIEITAGNIVLTNLNLINFFLLIKKDIRMESSLGYLKNIIALSNRSKMDILKEKGYDEFVNFLYNTYIAYHAIKITNLKIKIYTEQKISLNLKMKLAQSNLTDLLNQQGLSVKFDSNDNSVFYLNTADNIPIYYALTLIPLIEIRTIYEDYNYIMNNSITIFKKSNIEELGSEEFKTILVHLKSHNKRIFPKNEDKNKYKYRKWSDHE